MFVSALKIAHSQKTHKFTTKNAHTQAKREFLNKKIDFIYLIYRIVRTYFRGNALTAQEASEGTTVLKMLHKPGK